MGESLYGLVSFSEKVSSRIPIETESLPLRDPFLKEWLDCRFTPTTEKWKNSMHYRFHGEKLYSVIDVDHCSIIYIESRKSSIIWKWHNEIFYVQKFLSITMNTWAIYMHAWKKFFYQVIPLTSKWNTSCSSTSRTSHSKCLGSVVCWAQLNSPHSFH